MTSLRDLKWIKDGKEIDTKFAEYDWEWSYVDSPDDTPPEDERLWMYLHFPALGAFNLRISEDQARFLALLFTQAVKEIPSWYEDTPSAVETHVAIDFEEDVRG